MTLTLLSSTASRTVGVVNSACVDRVIQRHIEGLGVDAPQTSTSSRSQECADGFLNAHTGTGGLLDPTFGLRYSVAAAPSPWNLVVEAAV